MTRAAEPALPVGLIAITVAGLALMLSQTPLAHYGTAAGALFGLAVAGGGLAIARRQPVVPALATALNVFVLLVVVARPGWLSLGSWHADEAADESNTVLAIGHDGAAVPAPEWVDAHNASWQRGPVRVSIGRVLVGALDRNDSAGQKQRTREKYLQVRVRVKNSGVHGGVAFKGWGPGDVRLTDSSGQEVARRTFDDGREPSGRVGPASLGPSESAEFTLLFDAVPTSVQHLRLELSGAAFGAPEVARLHVPWLMIQFRSTP